MFGTVAITSSTSLSRVCACRRCCVLADPILQPHGMGSEEPATALSCVPLHCMHCTVGGATLTRRPSFRRRSPYPVSPAALTHDLRLEKVGHRLLVTMLALIWLDMLSSSPGPVPYLGDAQPLARRCASRHNLQGAGACELGGEDDITLTSPFTTSWTIRLHSTAYEGAWRNWRLGGRAKGQCGGMEQLGVVIAS